METLPQVQERRLVIAVDYGTTYTGVAIATPVGNRAYLEEIDVIQDWGANMGNHQKIPSVISYSLKSANREQQWGTDLSPKAIAMVHTKLQLDVDDTSAELELILQALDGMHNLDFRYIRDAGSAPKYPRKGPEEIVEDYLTKVFDYLLQAVSSFTQELRDRIPVDIVATVPAEWGYRAKNSTFRALTKAGFSKETFPLLNEVILVSEPEAAAVYTARFLKEDNGGDFLRQNECFVLCDAGGGTVDVVSYRVKQLQPTFEIEPVTRPLGKKCGSIFINLAFKEWLRKLIGDENYQQLDQAQLVNKISSHDAEGERMRQLMKSFDVYKRKFLRGHRDIKIDLPEPFENLTLEGKVVGGQITITYDDMKSFFEPRADSIVELIQSQVEEIEGLRTRLRYVFLVGGFAESQYLQETIRDSLEMRDLELKIPDTSWTAVVRGAAIFGIEKSATHGMCTMTGCPRSYGVPRTSLFSDVIHTRKDLDYDPLTKNAVAKEQLQWLIRKGDVVLSNKSKTVTAGPFAIQFTETAPRKGTIPVYSYDGDRIPERLSNSQNDLTLFHQIEFDLQGIPLEIFEYHNHPSVNIPFYVASLDLQMRVEGQNLHITLLLKDRTIYTRELPLTPTE